MKMGSVESPGILWLHKWLTFLLSKSRGIQKTFCSEYNFVLQSERLTVLRSTQSTRAEANVEIMSHRFMNVFVCYLNNIEAQLFTIFGVDKICILIACYS